MPNSPTLSTPTATDDIASTDSKEAPSSSKSNQSNDNYDLKTFFLAHFPLSHYFKLSKYHVRNLLQDFDEGGAKNLERDTYHKIDVSIAAIEYIRRPIASKLTEEEVQFIRRFCLTARLTKK